MNVAIIKHSTTPHPTFHSLQPVTAFHPNTAGLEGRSFLPPKQQKDQSHIFSSDTSVSHEGFVEPSTHSQPDASHKPSERQRCLPLKFFGDCMKYCYQGFKNLSVRFFCGCSKDKSRDGLGQASKLELYEDKNATDRPSTLIPNDVEDVDDGIDNAKRNGVFREVKNTAKQLGSTDVCEGKVTFNSAPSFLGTKGAKLSNEIGGQKVPSGPTVCKIDGTSTPSTGIGGILRGTRAVASGVLCCFGRNVQEDVRTSCGSAEISWASKNGINHTLERTTKEEPSSSNGQASSRHAGDCTQSLAEINSAPFFQFVAKSSLSEMTKVLQWFARNDRNVVLIDESGFDKMTNNAWLVVRSKKHKVTVKILVKMISPGDDPFKTKPCFVRLFLYRGRLGSLVDKMFIRKERWLRAKLTAGSQFSKYLMYFLTERVGMKAIE